MQKMPLSSSEVQGRYSFIASLILFLILIYFPIFLHLEGLAVRIFDESRLAMNALEMSDNGNLLVTHYSGAPDMWNTKPPLMINLQALCIRIFGPGELAIRLPAALAALGTTLMLFFFSKRWLADSWFGLITALVLVTASGYIGLHVARTGDFDALLTMFTTLAGLSFFLFMEGGRLKHLHWFFAALTLAVLTKAIAGLMFLPAYFIYMLLRKKWNLLRTKWLLYDSLLFIVIIAAYYLGREAVNPGYLKAVWDNELGGRYLEVNEGHDEEFLFYYLRLYLYDFNNWFWFSAAGLVMGLLSNDRRLRLLTAFSAIAAVSFWLVISCARTKLEWYIAPAYPFLSVMAAVPIYLGFKLLVRWSAVRSLFNYNPVPVLFLFIAFWTPYNNILAKVYVPKEYSWEEETYAAAYVLRDYIRGKVDLTNTALCVESFWSHCEFYQRVLAKEGKQLPMVRKEELLPDMKVLAGQPEVKNYIESQYEVEIVDTRRYARIYRILAKKPALQESEPEVL